MSGDTPIGSFVTAAIVDLRTQSEDDSRRRREADARDQARFKQALKREAQRSDEQHQHAAVAALARQYRLAPTRLEQAFQAALTQQLQQAQLPEEPVAREPVWAPEATTPEASTPQAHAPATSEGAQLHAPPPPSPQSSRASPSQTPMHQPPRALPPLPAEPAPRREPAHGTPREQSTQTLGTPPAAPALRATPATEPQPMEQPQPLAAEPAIEPPTQRSADLAHERPRPAQAPRTPAPGLQAARPPAPPGGEAQTPPLSDVAADVLPGPLQPANVPAPSARNGIDDGAPAWAAARPLPAEHATPSAQAPVPAVRRDARTAGSAPVPARPVVVTAQPAQVRTHEAPTVDTSSPRAEARPADTAPPAGRTSTPEARNTVHEAVRDMREPPTRAPSERKPESSARPKGAQPAFTRAPVGVTPTIKGAVADADIAPEADGAEHAAEAGSRPQAAARSPVPAQAPPPDGRHADRHTAGPGLPREAGPMQVRHDDDAPPAPRHVEPRATILPADSPSADRTAAMAPAEPVAPAPLPVPDQAAPTASHDRTPTSQRMNDARPRTDNADSTDSAENAEGTAEQALQRRTEPRHPAVQDHPRSRSQPSPTRLGPGAAQAHGPSLTPAPKPAPTADGPSRNAEPADADDQATPHLPLSADAAIRYGHEAGNTVASTAPPPAAPPARSAPAPALAPASLPAPAPAPGQDAGTAVQSLQSHAAGALAQLVAEGQGLVRLPREATRPAGVFTLKARDLDTRPGGDASAQADDATDTAPGPLHGPALSMVVGRGGAAGMLGDGHGGPGSGNSGGSGGHAGNGTPSQSPSDAAQAGATQGPSALALALAGGEAAAARRPLEPAPMPAGPAGVSAAVPVRQATHEQILDRYVGLAVDNLVVGDGRSGNRQVRMDLKDDLLPGVSVTVQEQDGRLQVDFTCAVEAVRLRLSEAAPAQARKLADRLGRAVLVRVRASDDAEPHLVEATAQPGTTR